MKVVQFFDLESSQKLYITGLNLHEIKGEFLLDYNADFELNGLRTLAPIERKTK